MKKIISLIFILFFILLLSSCNGFQKTNKFHFDTIYSEEKITFYMDKIEWNPGLSRVGGAEIKTSKTEQEVIQELEGQGITFLNELAFSKVLFFQVAGKGLWSLQFNNQKNDTHFIIREMSMYLKNDVFIPFPLYGIYEDVLLEDINLNDHYENVDYEYVYQSLIEFNKLVDTFSQIEKKENEIHLGYSSYQLILTFDSKNLCINLV